MRVTDSDTRAAAKDACGQVRHIARSQHPGQHAHTVVTGDALPTSRATSPGVPRFEPGAAHQAVDAKLQEGRQLP